jgi:2-polyprenyl-3-methyl-5-hydroxy-6-metoxy-1,4-benzoquinol methylase
MSEQVRVEAQPVGSRTLEIFEGSDRLNRWIYDRFAAELGQRVLEIGAGIGNITQFMTARDLLVATDVEDSYVTRLGVRFAPDSQVKVRKLDLDHPDPELEGFNFDSVLAVNVLEHIRDDMRVLRWIRKLVGAGGKVCLYVPALQVLFGSMDRALGHHRRYERSELIEKVTAAGFRCSSCRWMNVLAMPGWYVSGRLLRRKVVSGRQVALYDALVPFLRFEDRLRLPFGMNLTIVGVGV